MNEKSKEQRDSEQQESLKQAEQYAKEHLAKKGVQTTPAATESTTPKPEPVVVQKPKKVVQIPKPTPQQVDADCLDYSHLFTSFFDIFAGHQMAY